MLPIKWKSALDNCKPVILTGVYDPLSYLVASKSNFDGVFWSSFSMSIANALPDRSLINPTDISYVMSKSMFELGIPSIVDAEAGYGGINQLIQAVRTFIKAGASGVMIEDYCYPKICSLENITSRKLCSEDEMCTRIKALRKTFGSEICIIARTESFIVGEKVDYALERAKLYVKSGCDAVAVHNNTSSVDLLFEFGKRWDKKTPLVAIPTTYGHIDAETMCLHGYNIIVYANVFIRCAVKAMLSVSKILGEGKTLSDIEESMASTDACINMVDNI